MTTRRTMLAGGAPRLAALLLGAASTAGQLQADFSATPVSGTEPLTVDFTDLSTGDTPIAWSWTFGDGATSSVQHPTHVYTEEGTYDVSLLVISATAFDSVAKAGLVVVDPHPLVVDFDATPSQGASPLEVEFQDLSAGAPVESWTWDFGDGGTSTAQHPTHLYLAAGSYDVTLTATSGGHPETLVVPDAVTVSPPAVDVAFQAAPVDGASPLAVQFTDTSPGGPLDAWLWDFGDGTTSTLQHPLHVYDVPDTTSFTVTFTGTLGPDSGTLVVPDLVTVDPDPVDIAFGGAPTQGTLPLVVTFDNQTQVLADPVDDWLWDFGDGATSTQEAPFHVYDTAGTFDVSLTATVGEVTQALTKTAFVTVDPAPVAVDFTAAPTDGEGALPVQFTDLTQGATIASWDWDFGDGLTGTGQAPVHTYEVDVPTTFPVTLTTTVGQQLDSLTKPGLVHVVPGPFGARRVVTSTTMGSLTALDTGDLDGDGDLDVLWARSLSQVGFVRNLDGLGTFGSQVLVAQLTQPTHADLVRAADVDGDGDLDVLWAGAAEIAWAENVDGLGSFAPPTPVPSFGATALEVYDLDGDGDVDLLTTEQQTQGSTVGWCENLDGLGTFGPQQPVTLTDSVGAATAADLDGDGDLDVASTSTLGNPLAWHANTDGAGTFGASTTIDRDTSEIVTALAAGDVDGDGDVDVFASRTAFLRGRLVGYANDGAGDFAPPVTIDGTPHAHVDLVDLDRDGDLDALVAAGVFGEIARFENLDGAGNFGPKRIVTRRSYNSSPQVATGDLDGDGDLDVLGLGNSSSGWWRNRQLQPPWSDLGGGAPGVDGPPVLTVNGSLGPGSNLNLELFATPPNAPTLLWLSFASTPRPVVGGVLHAYPPANQFFRVTDGDGVFRLPGIPWPAGVPAGTGLWLQFIVQDASVPAGLTLSNAVTATAP